MLYQDTITINAHTLGVNLYFLNDKLEIFDVLNQINRKPFDNSLFALKKPSRCRIVCKLSKFNVNRELPKLIRDHFASDVQKI